MYQTSYLGRAVVEVVLLKAPSHVDGHRRPMRERHAESNFLPSTRAMSSSFQSIFDAALSDYARQTGVDLATYPFAQTVQNSHSADAILDLLQDKAEEFRTYRDGNRKLINCLKPIVQVLYAVSGFLAQASASVSPPINYYLILF